MSSLLNQVNTAANVLSKEYEVAYKNIDIIKEKTSLTTTILNEAFTTWLANLKNVIATGSIDPDKKQAAIYILAALAALSNEDFTDVFDDSGTIGSILDKASSQNHTESEAALQKLVAIGREPSLKTFVARASKAIEDPTAVNEFADKLRGKLEPIMNRKLSQERGTSKF